MLPILLCVLPFGCEGKGHGQVVGDEAADMTRMVTGALLVESGQSAAGWRVVALSSDGAPITLVDVEERSATTDEDGKWALGPLDPSVVYRLRVRGGSDEAWVDLGSVKAGDRLAVATIRDVDRLGTTFHAVVNDGVGVGPGELHLSGILASGSAYRMVGGAIRDGVVRVGPFARGQIVWVLVRPRDTDESAWSPVLIGPVHCDKVEHELAVPKISPRELVVVNSGARDVGQLEIEWLGPRRGLEPGVSSACASATRRVLSESECARLKAGTLSLQVPVGEVRLRARLDGVLIADVTVGVGTRGTWHVDIRDESVWMR